MGKLRNYFRRRRIRLEHDLESELEYHVERRVDELVGEGFTESDALRRAHQEFGENAKVRESVRETWTWSILDALVLDLRYAIRCLAKKRGYAIGVGAVLALAVGANTAIFSVVSTVLLQPLPFPDPERIVSIETVFTNTGQSSPMVSAPDFLDWQARNDVFDHMAVFYSGQDFAARVNDRGVFANPQYVSADFFSVFGQVASAGRLLTEQDVPAPGAEPTTAVVSHPWAVTHFGSAAAAIGKSFVLENVTLEVVGVTAEGFRYPRAADFWLSFNAQLPPDVPENVIQAQRSDYAYRAVGILKPGVPLASAEVRLQAIGDSIAQQYSVNRLKTVAITPLRDQLTGSAEATLWVLMTAVSVLWLIACANIANLLIARTAGRTREFALLAAIGAGRGRVVQRLLTESTVLAGLACLAGLLLAFLLIQGTVMFAPADLPRIDEVRMDASALVFGLTLSLVSAVLFGLVPAVQVSQLGLSDSLKEGGAKTTAARANIRLRSGLVVAEVALSVILLAGAGLLVRSFQALENVDLGFSTDRVLAAYLEYPSQGRAEFYGEVLDRLRASPGVEAAAGVAYLGMGWEPRALRDVFVQGRPEGRVGERLQAEIHGVTEDYFRTLEIPVLAGRDFARTDTPESPRVAVINETLARIAFPGESPLGQYIQHSNERAPWHEIVGVVGDTRWQDPSQAAQPMVYASSMQGYGNSPSILARTSLDTTVLASTLLRILNDVQPAMPVKFATMNEMFSSTLAYPRFRSQVIGLFAGLAAVLAAVGIVSVLAYMVGLRTRELALRQALGAKAGDIVRLIMNQGFRLVASGLIIGLVGALAATQLLESFLYEISPWNFSAYLGAVIVLCVLAFVAILVPAVRAGTINPMKVMQRE